MYRSHYNLKERPFEISTDTRFLWMGEKHKEALAMLKYGVLARKGFLLLTGDVGTGKTTLVHALLESLTDDTLVANINDPLLSPIDFFNFIAASFHMAERFHNKVDFLLRFSDFLREADAAGKNVLLILDEAHRLSMDLLEQFRLLSNIELPEKKLINIFFVGQNEFNRTLASEDCRALRQRITLNYNIKPLTEAETLEYIQYRLKVAGTESEIFHRKSVGEVYRFSQGYPRLINIVCDHALLTGYVRRLTRITPAVIEECSHELCLMGDTIRVSSSDFFETKGTRVSTVSPGPGAALPKGVPGSAAAQSDKRFPIGQQACAIQQGVLSGDRTGPPSAHASGRPAPDAKKTKRRTSAAMAAFVTVIAAASALLLQKDLFLGAAEGGRTESVRSAPPPGLRETDPSVSPPAGPDTIPLAPFDPLVQARADGRVATVKRSPYEMAREEMDKGNVDRAIRLLEEAIAERPADLPRLRALYAETLRSRAALFSDHEPAKAERFLARAVEADPKNAGAHFDLGGLYTKSSRYPEAIHAYEKAAGLDDRSADTFFNLGFAYAAAGKYDHAEKMFARAAALRPPYLDKALFNLAAVQRKQGKEKECVKSLEQALSENPNNERARTYLNQLKPGPRGSP